MRGVEWTDDVERGAWIAPRLRGWGLVGGVVPRGFEAYARVLHPLRATTERGEERWRWAEVARRTGRTMHPLVQWNALIGAPADAFNQGADFDDGSHVAAPEPGRLSPEPLAALAMSLVAATESDDVTIAVWEGWGMNWGLAAAARLTLPERSYRLLGGASAELTDPGWRARTELSDRPPFEGPMPQLIWPGDNAWCVASEIDFDSTLVGGSRALIEAVLANPVLEAYEVGPDDSLDMDGDLVNV